MSEFAPTLPLWCQLTRQKRYPWRRIPLEKSPGGEQRVYNVLCEGSLLWVIRLSMMPHVPDVHTACPQNQQLSVFVFVFVFILYLHKSYVNCWSVCTRCHNRLYFRDPSGTDRLKSAAKCVQSLLNACFGISKPDSLGTPLANFGTRWDQKEHIIIGGGYIGFDCLFNHRAKPVVTNSEFSLLRGELIVVWDLGQKLFKL